MKLWRYLVLAWLLAAAATWAQRRGGGRGWGGGGEGWVPEDAPVRTAREVPSHSTGTPNWTNEFGFEHDVFNFARIAYQRLPRGYGSRSGGNCFTDFPDSDLNLSYRLQQCTSLKVDPDGRVIRLTDPELSRYPWIYMVEPGALHFRNDELPLLRDYLLKGGVLMADDFWGAVQWAAFEREIKRVLPERAFVELPMDHPLFHCVFDIQGPKNKLQIPNIGQGARSEYDGITWEFHDGEECMDVHIRAIFDEQGHIMVIAAHNTDNGDGWEREGEAEFFFHEFSEKRAYPFAINTIFYLMTH